MANLLFSNIGTSLLNTSILSTDTTIELQSGFGARFPNPSAPESFFITLEDDQGNFEVCRCTARVGDILTVDRQEDNTVAQNFTQNVTRVELRVNAGTLDVFAQTSGFTMSGDINLGGNNVVDAVLTGALTTIAGGQIVGVPLRGAVDDSTNEIVVPPAGARATAGGVSILVSNDDLIPQLDAAGVIDLSSATVGVKVGTGGGYLRVTNAADDSYRDETSDGTNLLSVFTGLADWNISGLTGAIVLGTGVDLDVGTNQLKQAKIVDFQVKSQTVAASPTTNVNYELGSYVTLNMGQNITALNITNPPADEFATVRLKIVQGATGGRTIANWPGTTFWPGAAAPALSTAANAIDFVDLWTDDGGVSWYGAFASTFGT